MEDEKTPEEKYAETLKKQEEKRKEIRGNPEALKRMDERKKQKKEKEETLKKKPESKFNVNFKSLIKGIIFAIVFGFAFLFSTGEVEIWALGALFLGILCFYLLFESRPISQTTVILVGILAIAITSNYYGFFGINIIGAIIVFVLYGFYLITRVAFARFKEINIDGVNFHVPGTLSYSEDREDYYHKEYITHYKGGKYYVRESRDSVYNSGRIHTITTQDSNYLVKIRVYKYKSLEQVLYNFKSSKVEENKSYKIVENVFGKYSGFRVDKINSAWDGYEPEWFVFEKKGRIVAVNFESNSLSSFKINVLKVISGRSGIELIYN